MAKGWESKSVEEQQEQSAQSADTAKPNRQVVMDTANRSRQRQELELQRERILDERTSSPIRRKALEAALNEIENRLAGL
jgi:hypothetical protein